MKRRHDAQLDPTSDGRGRASPAAFPAAVNLQQSTPTAPQTLESALSVNYPSRQQQSCWFGGSFLPTFNTRTPSISSETSAESKSWLLSSALMRRPVSPDATTISSASSAGGGANSSNASNSTINTPTKKVASKRTTKRAYNSKKNAKKASSASSQSHPEDPARPLSDDFLAQELNNLSITERQQAYEDIHGVSATVQETPALLQKSLSQMQTDLLRILAATTSSAIAAIHTTASLPTKPERQVYEKATFYSPKSVHNPDLQLLFLRCEDYDTTAAAIRYIKFWHLQYTIFDECWDCILKPSGPTQDDLLELEGCKDEAESFLRMGFLHVLPKPDQSGRAVLTFFNRRCMYKHWKDAARTCFYVMMNMLKQNVNAQIRGIVGIAYECVKKEDFVLPFDLELLAGATGFYSAMPLKFKAYHFCYDDPKMAPAMSLVQLALGKRTRVRFRSHFGTDVECRYQLMTFGIPVKAMPVDEDTSTVILQNSHQWLEECRSLQNAYHPQQQKQQQQHFGGLDTIDNAKRNVVGTAIIDALDYPTSKDVLLGRGRPYQEHAGNRNLNATIDKYWQTYREANRSRKMSLFSEIVMEMKNSGTRFLQKRKTASANQTGPQQNVAEWELVHDVKARAKVSHTFRNKPIMTKYHSSKNNNATSENDSQKTGAESEMGMDMVMDTDMDKDMEGLVGAT